MATIGLRRRCGSCGSLGLVGFITLNKKSMNVTKRPIKSVAAAHGKSTWQELLILIKPGEKNIYS